jgi:hypothetical protein
LSVFPEDELAGLVDVAPEVQAALCGDGVPRSFFGQRFKTTEHLITLDATDGRRVVRFGTEGLASAICVDPTRGNVLAIHAPNIDPGFVNSSLAQFTQTVKAVVERFPYYERDASDDVVAQVGRDLAAIIGAIDSRALTPDSYWATFVDDVVYLRDFATEDIRLAPMD